MGKAVFMEDSAKANVLHLLSGDDIKLLLQLKRDATKRRVVEKEKNGIATSIRQHEFNWSPVL
jgi:hypothetical protein